jgi:hypothetical protein
MIRLVLALVALSTPALADDYTYHEQFGRDDRQFLNDLYEPTPRRSYQPTYQEPVQAKPDTRYDSYRLDNAIRQIPGWNKQFPNYGR